MAPSISEFADLPLPASLLEALSSLGLSRPLPVQSAALPHILAGRDVLARAPTGSGKTVAFGLGILARLEAPLEVQSLVACPTRELADQVSASLRRLACRMPNVKVLSLSGGLPFAPQRASLARGAHVVVGTPGRIDEHLRKGSLSLDKLKVLVLDEADRMLDMGFEPQIATIIVRTPSTRQTLLFSATYPSAISALSGKYQREAIRIDVSSQDGSAALGEDGMPAGLEQRFFRVRSGAHGSALERWLATERPDSALVFASTRIQCAEVAARLRAVGWTAASLHGEMGQRERQHVLRLFAGGSCSVLVATDVAARGWDMPSLPLVVNLGLPRDLTTYVHRSGRTARLGRAGKVVSFVAEEDEPALAALERARGGVIALEELPPRAPPGAPPKPPFVTLLLSAGKNKKLRPGDVLGALTAPGGVDESNVGAIVIDESTTYVAIRRGVAEQALAHLNRAGVKGRRVKVTVANL